MAWRVRFVALLSAGAVSVHELRYALAYGPHADHAAAQQGHAYLPVVAAGVALLVLTAAVEVLRRLARGNDATRAPRFGRMWAASTALLVVVYAAQEWVEGALARGHPAGLAGVVGHGGWTALVLAVGVGALIALALRGAAQARRPAAPAAWFSAAQPRPRSATPSRWLGPRLDVLALHLAERGPPPTSE